MSGAEQQSGQVLRRCLLPGAVNAVVFPAQTLSTATRCRVVIPGCLFIAVSAGGVRPAARLPRPCLF